MSQGAPITVEKDTIQHLLWALKPLVNLRGSIPFPFVTTFLAVALEEGNSPSSYARGAGVRRYTMHRWLHAIGDRSRSGGPGFGLVRFEPDPKRANMYRIYLTPRGRAIAADIFRNLKRHQRAIAA
jgi:DNA-binding MarR family transcriptional regulator